MLRLYFVKKLQIMALALATLLFNEAAFAESQSWGNLQVVVTGIKSIQGQVIANLFREGDDIHGQPVAKRQLAVVDKQVSLAEIR